MEGPCYDYHCVAKDAGISESKSFVMKYSIYKKERKWCKKKRKVSSAEVNYEDLGYELKH